MTLATVAMGMRAIIHDEHGVRLDTNCSLPRAQGGEAVIRLLKAAVSAADVPALRSGGAAGKSLQPNASPRILGHAFVGTVERVEGESSHPLTGKRVVGSIITACGKCDMCVAGLGNHCRERTILGMHGRDGCLAEFFTLPVRQLAAVPDSLDNDHAVFASELAAAIQAAQQLTIVNKPYITVLGDNSLGLLTVQVMGRLNASVRLVGQHNSKLAMCEKWGVKHRHADDVGRRADQDIVVDCTGSAEGFALAMRLVRPRGKIVLKSLYPAGGNDAVDLSPIVLNEIEVIGSFAGPISEALAMLERSEVDVLSLITRRMSLSDGPATLRVALQPETVKVLVEP